MSAIIAALSTVAYTGIAFFQLSVMRAGADSSTQQLWAAIGNINWMAKNMDKSIKDASRQVTNTHDLALTAQSQATGSTSLVNTAQAQSVVMGRQLDQMRTGQMMQDRPWVELISIQGFGAITHDVNGMEFHCVLTVKNTGHAPARNLQMIPTIFSTKKSRAGSVKQAQEESCQQGRKMVQVLSSDTDLARAKRIP